jgi:hypothetical protein
VRTSSRAAAAPLSRPGDSRSGSLAPCGNTGGCRSGPSPRSTETVVTGLSGAGPQRQQSAVPPLNGPRLSSRSLRVEGLRRRTPTFRSGSQRNSRAGRRRLAHRCRPLVTLRHPLCQAGRGDSDPTGAGRRRSRCGGPQPTGVRTRRRQPARRELRRADRALHPHRGRPKDPTCDG